MSKMGQNQQRSAKTNNKCQQIWLPAATLAFTCLTSQAACAQLLPDTISTTATNSLNILLQQGQDAIAQGKSALAQKLLKKALGMSKTFDTQQYVQTTQNLAQLYQNTGKLQLAADTAKQAVLEAEKYAKINPSGLATSLSTLANIQMNNSQTAEAETNYIRALELVQTDPNKGRESATYLDNLGCLYQQEKRYTEALQLHEQALRLFQWQNANTAMDKDYAVCMGNLANCYEHLGKNDLADATHKKALELIKSSFGDTSSTYASALDNYALLCMRQSRLGEADSLQQQALNIMQDSKIQNPQDMAVLLNNMTSIKFRQHDLPGSLKFAKQAYDINRKLFGTNSPSVLQSKSIVTNIASLIAKGKAQAVVSTLANK